MSLVTDILVQKRQIGSHACMTFSAKMSMKHGVMTFSAEMEMMHGKLTLWDEMSWCTVSWPIQLECEISILAEVKFPAKVPLMHNVLNVWGKISMLRFEMLHWHFGWTNNDNSVHTTNTTNNYHTNVTVQCKRSTPHPALTAGRTCSIMTSVLSSKYRSD